MKLSLSPRAKRLAVVLDINRREEDAALRRWGDIQQRLRSEHDKRSQLDQYANEYRRNITTPGQGQMRSGDIQNSLGFIGQIEQAMVQQDTQLKELQAQCERARQAYLDMHNKAEAMQKMIDRLEKEFSAEQSRSEQREADEWASRQHRS